MRVSYRKTLEKRMPAEHALPDATELFTYLKTKGWNQSPPGPAGSIWFNDQARIGVPHDDDPDLIEGSIQRVARFERRSPEAVIESVRFLLYDITHLRATSDRAIADTIPLDAASKILSSARKMLRATATTARGERAQIAGNYSKLGNNVVKQALMGHTERGSFVIPVLVALPEPDPIDIHPTLLTSEELFHRASPEPFERRVVRTFAQCMQAIREIVVEPEREPRAEQIYELIYRGVSREFCTSLTDILSERSVSQFGSKVDWSPAVSPPSSMSQSVTIDSTAVDRVKRVASRLRRQRVDPNQIFSGTIVQLRHENQDDPFADIWVSTMRHGRPSEVLVRLPVDLYREAWGWHSSGRAVLIEGIVRRSTPGGPLRVDAPVRCHPVDEMFLPGIESPAPAGPNQGRRTRPERPPLIRVVDSELDTPGNVVEPGEEAQQEDPE